eukprot:NODE_5747_length_680_cov_4.817750_g4860_i0.p3 GENE.NODE_5747_length_680_cov_4.817750_g4860_i0~~NODE_5747_length_680_cov_4.817750_g4860_i0.p3  ORF type:complete len:51 (-),score=0.47 NODE_5747_length_680_cov_4.817750_g4860_i0:64-216(-)
MSVPTAMCYGVVASSACPISAVLLPGASSYAALFTEKSKLISSYCTFLLP